MKKTFLFAVLFALFSGGAQAQTNAWADYFTLADSSHTFFVAPAGSTLSAYSAPGGGRLLREAVSSSEKWGESWAFENATRPAFLMIRNENQGAKVFPLETPVFRLEHIQKEAGAIPVFQCLAAGRPDATAIAALWVKEKGQWKQISAQPLAQDLSAIRFADPALSSAEAAQVRFSASGIRLHTEALFATKSAAPAGLQVFPNPAASFFTVLAPTSGRFTLSDLTGKVVFSGNLNAGRNEIVPAALPVLMGFSSPRPAVRRQPPFPFSFCPDGNRSRQVFFFHKER